MKTMMDERKSLLHRRWVIFVAFAIGGACVFVFFAPHTIHSKAFLGLTSFQMAVLAGLLALEIGLLGLLWRISARPDKMEAFEKKVHRATFGDPFFNLINAAWFGLVSCLYLLLKWGVFMDLSAYASILVVVLILLVLVAVICAGFLLLVRKEQRSASGTGRASLWDRLMILVSAPKKFALLLAEVAGGLAALSVIGLIIRFKLPQVYAGVDWAVCEFYLSSEMNFPTFFSVVLLIFTGVLMLVISWLRGQQGKDFAGRWGFLGAIFFLLAADELFAFHEQLTEPVKGLINGRGLLYWPWFLPLIPALVVLLLVYLKFIAQLPGKTRWLILLSAFLFVGSAVVLEALCARFAETHTTENLTYTLMATFEEVGELTGLILLIYTLLCYLKEEVMLSEGTAIPDSPVV